MNRTPPADRRRQLRKEVGFGCPVAGCRKPFLTWHHFDPPWNERNHHEVKGMIALCREHHDEADAGLHSKDELRALKTTTAVAETVTAQFDCWAKKSILVRLGGMYCGGSALTLAVENQPIITLNRRANGLLEVSFKLRSADGTVVLEMEDNGFECTPSLLHDLETDTGKTKVKMWFKKLDIGLDLSFRRITIDELKESLAEDKLRSDKQSAGILEAVLANLPPEMRAMVENPPPGSFAHFPEQFRTAYESGDHVGWHIQEWVKANCLDDEGMIPFLDFKNMKLHEAGRAIVIRSGIQEGERHIGYGGAFDNAAGAINL